MEYLDIVTDDGIPTGRVKEREAVHRDGDRHRTSHVWIIRENKESGIDLLLQKRSRTKESWPGCYDISSAGHIPAGEDYESSALRELSEELGIIASREELLLCGTRIIDWRGEFSGAPFWDREVSRVYALRRETLDISRLTLQPEEVDSTRWMDFEACCRAVKENTFRHCIYMEELQILRRALFKSATRFSIS